MGAVFDLMYFLNMVVGASCFFLVLIKALQYRNRRAMGVLAASSLMFILVVSSTLLHYYQHMPGNDHEYVVIVLNLLVITGIVTVIVLARHLLLRNQEGLKWPNRISRAFLATVPLVLLPMLWSRSFHDANQYLAYAIFLFFLPSSIAFLLGLHFHTFAPGKPVKNPIADHQQTLILLVAFIAAYLCEILQLLPVMRIALTFEHFHVMLLVLSGLGVNLAASTSKLMPSTEHDASPVATSLPGSPELAMLLKHPALRELTAREQELLEHLLGGKEFDDIANTMFLSIRTVRNHASSIYSKLGCRSRTSLMAKLKTLVSSPDITK